MPSQTDLLDTAALLSDLRREFSSVRTRGLSWRLEQLRGIERLCDEREAEIVAALA
jgi:aldehyde dehydrogenase (NAD+)